MAFSDFGPPGNVVRMAVAACLWPTTFEIPSVRIALQRCVRTNGACKSEKRTATLNQHELRFNKTNVHNGDSEFAPSQPCNHNALKMRVGCANQLAIIIQMIIAKHMKRYSTMSPLAA